MWSPFVGMETIDDELDSALSNWSGYFALEQHNVNVGYNEFVHARTEGYLTNPHILLDEGAIPDRVSIGNCLLCPATLDLNDNKIVLFERLLQMGALTNPLPEGNRRSKACWDTSLGSIAQHIIEFNNDQCLPYMKCLLRNGYPPDSRNAHNMTALHHCWRPDHLPVARLLLEHGADVNAKDDFDEVPLYIVGQSQPEFTRLYFEYGAEISNLTHAMIHGNDPEASHFIPTPSNKADDMYLIVKTRMPDPEIMKIYEDLLENSPPVLK